MISRWMKDDVLTRVQQLKPIAEGCGLSMAQLAVAWTLANPNVSSAIIGASRPEQVTDNVKAAGVTLEDSVLAAIDEAPRRGASERGPGQDPVAAPLGDVLSLRRGSDGGRASRVGEERAHHRRDGTRCAQHVAPAHYR